jgi:triosephosphate isomerase (TIM)
MRRPLIAGNWKMNLNRSESEALAGSLAEQSGSIANADLLVCPPSVYLLPVAAAISGTSVALGAQNMYFEDAGAFTGEISAAMLRDVGADFVILGHSERRHILGETDDEVNRKAKKALSAGLAPIICVGETLQERESGQTAHVIRRQFSGSFAGLSAEQMQSTVVAYEPVWAIGTGRTATPQQAEEVHADLRKLIAEAYNTGVADSVPILYGGSVKPDNAGELLSQANVDGALVGGASLKADQFVAIARAAG